MFVLLLHLEYALKSSKQQYFSNTPGNYRYVVVVAAVGLVAGRKLAKGEIIKGAKK